MSTSTQTIEQLTGREYKYGFVTDVEQEAAPRGLNEDIVRLISAKKGEPDWLLDWRLRSGRRTLLTSPQSPRRPLPVPPVAPRSRRWPR